jgi:two-component system, LuxR family, response regulator FixJ
MLSYMGYMYRYRTPALLGGWFASADMACAEAIRSRQAYRDESGAMVWRGSARLEAVPDDDDRSASPRSAPLASPNPGRVVQAREGSAYITQESVSGDNLVAIVDDDESVRASTALLLAEAGIRSQAFASGDAFLASNPGLFTCVLLDLRMAGADGLSVLRQLAERDFAPPVLVITGHGDVPTGVKAMKLGAFDFLEKPYAPESLMRALAVGFDRGRGARDDREVRDRAAALMKGLSQRQLQVVQGVVRGQHNKIIAFELGLSIRTVETHRAEALKKLNVRSTAELIRLVGQADLPDD